MLSSRTGEAGLDCREMGGLQRRIPSSVVSEAAPAVLWPWIWTGPAVRNDGRHPEAFEGRDHRLRLTSVDAAGGAYADIRRREVLRAQDIVDAPRSMRLGRLAAWQTRPGTPLALVL